MAVSYSTHEKASKEELAPIARRHEPKRKELQQFIAPSPEKRPITVVGELDEAIDLSGIPEEHQRRIARIYKPTREATQSAQGNTKVWRIELDTRERWENPLIGWCSTGDPLSNIDMNMKFATKEAAIYLCEKNGWDYEIQEPHKPYLKPKNYGDNFAWNKRYRIWTK